MPKLLKDIYNSKYIDLLGDAIKTHYPHFSIPKFHNHVFNSLWHSKELKARMQHIASSMHKLLPNSYKKSIAILKPVASKFSGLEGMVFPTYIEIYGLEYYNESMQALEYFTKYSSSEFAIRPFILKHPIETMAQMSRWADSNNEHVRRLASEGCRPRLPWAMALPKFKESPKIILNILEKLKNDSSKYVRRSVANNLNDISKDNPKILIALAKLWLGKTDNTDWIIKHSCRSLLKQGNLDVMCMFGFSKPNHIKINNFTASKIVYMGKLLKFSFALQSSANVLGKLRIEYVIGFMKNNGSQASKIFKVSESTCLKRHKEVIKNHSFKKISTRKYYAGEHTITLVINGYKLACSNFQLHS